MIELPNLLRFTKLLNEFRQIRRVVLVNGEDRWENDVEHSYQLAMVGWYLLQQDNFGLDCDLVLKYSLVHDLVEVYTGDTYIYGDKSDLATKQERESRALAKLVEEYYDFPELVSLIKGYESKSDRESKFVYVLDKILPILNIYLDNGRTWKEKEVSLTMIIEHKTEKMAQFPELAPLFEELVAILRAKESSLFLSGDKLT